ncbi:hypothetical protein [Achromobacter sp. MFA1 R4]|uniref:hypothetical protein n=1 Tax=Achromobacter sp. MFA1 R4 TaxID=1881016 RepID=UPI0012EBEE97|nr:hypothetical protein [Achromobacter sp. MFA1 R4]
MRKNSKAAATGNTSFAAGFHTFQKNVLEFGLFVVERSSKQVLKTARQAKTPQGIG